MKLQKSSDSATGLDDVHYDILPHLSDTDSSVFLQIHDEIRKNGSFPPPWGEAVIIPISTPGNDTSNPNNYRPIALTSCLCKTMERMVNTPLMWSLETQVRPQEIPSGSIYKKSFKNRAKLSLVFGHF